MTKGLNSDNQVEEMIRLGECYYTSFKSVAHVELPWLPRYSVSYRRLSFSLFLLSPQLSLNWMIFGPYQLRHATTTNGDHHNTRPKVSEHEGAETREHRTDDVMLRYIYFPFAHCISYRPGAPHRVVIATSCAFAADDADKQGKGRGDKDVALQFRV